MHRKIGTGTFPATLLSLGVALLLIILLLLFLSDTPKESLYYFFLGPFLGTYYIEKMINVTVVLIFTGLGASLAFRAGMINLGGEGQIYASALVTTLVALRLGERVSGDTVGANIATSFLSGPLPVLVAGLITGTVLAGFSGLFRVLWNTDELLSTFLISGAVIPIVDYAISGPFRDEESFLLATPEIPERFWVSPLTEGTSITTGIIVAGIAVLLLALFLRYTVWGYKLKLCGLNSEFAAYGGIAVHHYLFYPMAASGALHGLGGGIWVLSTHHMAIQGFTANMGWNGIAVALIARNNPSAAVPAAFLLAYLKMGSQTAVLQTEFAHELGALIQAVILLLITAHLWSAVRSERSERAGRERSL